MFGAVTFETRGPEVLPSARRADVAAFVGFSTLPQVPDAVQSVWKSLGWSRDPRPDKPILLETPAQLDWLDSTVVDSTGARYEGALTGAVRDFFRQGGRRCWVVPAGPPPPPPRNADQAESALVRLIPGFADSARSTPEDRSTWRGLAHLFDLPEVALLALPDLPFVVGASPTERGPAPEPRVLQPQFLECAEHHPPAPPGPTVVAYAAPRLGTDHLDLWQQALHAVLSWVTRYRPDLQVLASWPLGASDTAVHADPLAAAEARLVPLDAGGVGTAWLQLATPWLRTDTSAARLGGLAAPDGVLAGLLARNALGQGTYQRAVGHRPEGVRALQPAYDRQTLRRPGPTGRLPERLCVIGRAHQGLELRSDVTTTPEQAWRQGNVNRLLGVIRRAVTQLGQELVFESNHPDTWRRVRTELARVLTELQAVGALHPIDGFSVRCDRGTMSQQDLDLGRLIAHVSVRPVLAIEHISVVLTVLNGTATVHGGPA